MIAKLREWTIAGQLYALAATVLVGFAAVGAVDVVSRAAQDRAFTSHMAELADLRDAVDLDFLLLKARYLEKEFIIRADDRYVGEQDQLRVRLETALSRAVQAFTDGDEVAHIAAARAGVQAYFAHWDRFVADRRRLGFTADMGLTAELGQAAGTVDALLAAIVRERPTAEDEGVETALHDTLSAQAVMLLTWSEDGRARAAAAADRLRQQVEQSPHLAAGERARVLAAVGNYTRLLGDAVALTGQLSAAAGRFKVHYAPAKAGIDAVLTSTTASQALLEKDYTRARATGGVGMVTAILLSLVVVGSVALLIARTLSQRVRHLAAVMNAVAEGDLTRPIPYAGGVNEIGGMAKALVVFRANGKRLLEASERQKRLEAEAMEARRTATAELAASLDAATGEVVGDLQSTAGVMREDATALIGMVRHTQGLTPATAADDASSTVGGVAAAAEELSASIGEVVRQVGATVAASERARQAVDVTSGRITDLSEAAARIGEVIGLISDIAAQTNLLALNATIEAARAGEAGKGFAVVASEVKHLANQTARATDEISTQVRAIQGETASVVDEIRAISTVVSEVDAIARSMSDAMHMQEEATQGIAGAIARASLGASEISAQIGQVNEAITAAERSAERVGDLSGDLSGISTALSASVVRVLGQLRAQG
jgi:methyl-accepting chemotaxis protein